MNGGFTSVAEVQRMARMVMLALVLGSLGACSLWNPGPAKPKPADLGVNIPVLGVRQAWTVALGASTGAPLIPHVSGTTITIASSRGAVTAINALTGKDLWRLDLGIPLAAGVGGDEHWTAVVSQANEVVVLEAGREKWRQRLAAQTYTPPLVAGGRVFVLAADRTVTAFDAVNGRRLWSQSRVGEPLVLRQPGVLQAVGDTLVVGVAGRFVGLNPDNGTGRWEAPLAVPRGTNDVERLVELVGPVSRLGDSVCARAFQAAVGCIDATRANVNWTQKSNGAEGIAGDAAAIYGSQSDGSLAAWRRSDGEPLWTSSRLQYRKLTAPLLLGRSIVVGDESGLVHLLSREDGAPLNRLLTDGSGILTPPMAVADTLVVVTRKGNIYGFRPD